MTANAPDPNEPVAQRRPTLLSRHGHQRRDDYYWLRERDNPATLAYLNAENAHFDRIMQPTEALQETLYREIRGRVVEQDTTAPYRDGDYWYYARFERGSEYPIYARRQHDLDAPEAVILDVNALADGLPFVSVRGLSLSPDHSKLAYAIDTVGDLRYRLVVLDLATGEMLANTADNIAPGVAWSADGGMLFFVANDPQTMRSHRVLRQPLDSAASVDVYIEQDETFSVSVDTTRSRDFVQLVSVSTTTTEVRLLDAHAPERAAVVFAERKRDHEYYVDHDGEYFYVCSNDQALNFRLARTRQPGTPPAAWDEVVPHRDDVLLEDFELFERFLVLEQMRAGLTEIEIIERATGASHLLEFDQPAYTASLGDNHVYTATTLRFEYESMTTPASVFDYSMARRERQLVKQDTVLGGFAAGDYRAERLTLTARDGTGVPVSLVRHRDTPVDGSAPLLLYAYGAYGHSILPGFSSARLSLLKRGFICAIAHVRGGSDLGRHWYDAGKLANKQNTFDDFIDVARALVRAGYSRHDRMYAAGGSAGGLLIGAVINQAPACFHGAIAAVPFVDVVTTMLDDTIPLTTGEYDEWGDPRRPRDYRTMLAYSPYDNVRRQDYPHLLITTGLHDSLVHYWEPAKWVAKLRARRVNRGLLLLHVNMAAGHGGASGRFESIRDDAREYAFLLLLEQRRADAAVAEDA